MINVNEISYEVQEATSLFTILSTIITTYVVIIVDDDNKGLQGKIDYWCISTKLS